MKNEKIFFSRSFARTTPVVFRNGALFRRQRAFVFVFFRAKKHEENVFSLIIEYFQKILARGKSNIHAENALGETIPESKSTREKFKNNIKEKYFTILFESTTIVFGVFFPLFSFPLHVCIRIPANK